MSQLVSTRLCTLLISSIGCCIFAAGLDAFIIPHHLLAGGLSGVAVIIYYITQMPVGTANLLLNVPILLISYRWLGAWPVFLAVYGASVSSFFMNQLRFLSDYHLTNSPFVGAIVGGITVGLGLGIIYRSGATAGGTDPIAQIIRKYWGLQMGSIVFAMNVIILTTSAFIFNVDDAVITLISLFLSAMVSNKVVIGFNQQKAAIIISKYPCEISQHIMHNLGRGATLLNAEGAYSGDEKHLVFAVIRLTQVTRLKNEVRHIDPSAFMVITDAAEVVGNGFSNSVSSIRNLFSKPVTKDDIKTQFDIHGLPPHELLRVRTKEEQTKRTEKALEAVKRKLRRM